MTEDPYERLGRYVARVVAQQPSPPRTVRAVDVFEFVLGLRGAATLLAPAFVFMSSAFVVLLWQGWSPVRLAVVVVVLPAAGFLLARPFVAGARLLSALRRGVFTSAVVAEVTDARDGVRGRCDVRTADGDGYRARFELEAPWAENLLVGSTMVVLSHPRRRRVLWYVGLPQV